MVEILPKRGAFENPAPIFEGIFGFDTTGTPSPRQDTENPGGGIFGTLCFPREENHEAAALPVHRKRQPCRRRAAALLEAKGRPPSKRLTTVSRKRPIPLPTGELHGVDCDHEHRLC